MELVKGRGVYVWDAQGRKYLDGLASLVKGAGDGDLAFNFLGLIIKDGTAVVDFSLPGGGPRPKEEGLGQRGLAAAPVADQY